MDRCCGCFCTPLCATWPRAGESPAHCWRRSEATGALFRCSTMRAIRWTFGPIPPFFVPHPSATQATGGPIWRLITAKRWCVLLSSRALTCWRGARQRGRAASRWAGPPRRSSAAPASEAGPPSASPRRPTHATGAPPNRLAEPPSASPRRPAHATGAPAPAGGSQLVGLKPRWRATMPLERLRWPTFSQPQPRIMSASSSWLGQARMDSARYS